MNRQSPRERDIAFVFQSYALYPHLTVRENIAFPLALDKFKAWHHIPGISAFARRIFGSSKDIAEQVDASRPCWNWTSTRTASPADSPAASASAWPWHAP